MKELVATRQVICKILRLHYNGLSLKQIGHMLGGKDHTSIMHSVAMANLRLQNDEYYFVSRYQKAVKCVNRIINKKP